MQGIDNVLQAFTIMFFAGMFADSNYAHQDVIICIAVIIAATWLCLRFTDSFMILIAFAALLTCIYLIIQPGRIAYTFMPFIVMLMTAIIYWLQRRLSQITSLHLYKKCFYLLNVAALVSMYAAGNVYIINQLSEPSLIATKFNNDFYIMLWILSAAIPVIYIICGFIKRRILLLRAGFICGVATILSIHFYYSVLSAEAAFVTGGCLLMIIGYTGLSYFKHGRHGFTAKSYTTLNKDLINIETLISMQISGKQPSHQNIQFCSGSSGGAGASVNW